MNGSGDGGCDPQVVRKAVEQFERPLLTYALRIVGDLDRARDVVQETFARLCNQPPGSADVNGHLPQWLYTVCRNAALDARRKEKRAMPMLETTVAETVKSDQPTPSESAETRDATSHVLKMLSRLSDDQQEAIRLKFQHGMSYRQISAITGHSESNVGFLIHSGIKAIRSMM